MINRESLDQYVRRIIREKQLTLSEVERRADGDISDSYVSSITTRSIKNLTINKLKALARGLGVSEAQLLAVACGISLPDNGEFCESEFAELFHKYNELAAADKQQVRPLVEMVDREIERRLMRRDANGQNQGDGHRERRKQQPLSTGSFNQMATKSDRMRWGQG